MKNILLLLLLAGTLLSSATIKAQADSSFLVQKKIIDEQVLAIESDTLISNTPLTGTLLWGAFRANAIYILKTKDLLKLECFFDDSNAGKKVFYFHEGRLIKITDKGTGYYHINYLCDDTGQPLSRSTEKDLLFFCNEIKKMTLQLL